MKHIHYRDEHVDVRLSAEGLRRAANDNALHEAAMQKSENLLVGLAICSAIVFGAVVAFAAVYGN